MHSSRCREWQTETLYAARGGEQKTIAPGNDPDVGVSSGFTIPRASCIVAAVVPNFDAGSAPSSCVVTLVYEGDTPQNPKRWSCVVNGTKRVIPAEPVRDVLIGCTQPVLVHIESMEDNKPTTGIDE